MYVYIYTVRSYTYVYIHTYISVRSLRRKSASLRVYATYVCIYIYSTLIHICIYTYIHQCAELTKEVSKLKGIRDKLEQAGDLKKKLQEKDEETDKLLEQVSACAHMCMHVSI